MRPRRFVLVALALAAGGSAAAPASDIDDFQAALDRDDVRATAAIYAARVERISGAQPARDAQLDQMAGELLLRSGMRPAGLAFLEQARLSGEEAQKPGIALAIGRTYEGFGGLETAIREYRVAAALPASDRMGREARIALARILLARAPEEAATLTAEVIAAAGNPGERWEAELIAARAAALAGRGPAASALLASAWADATAAKPSERAVVRVARDMAQDALAAGDRARGIALYALGGASPAPSGSVQLPPCGKDGLRPEDSVIVEIGYGRYGPQYSAVRSSRPGIAAPFVNAIAAGTLPSQPGAPLVELRCEFDSLPSTARKPTDPMAEWTARSGLYPLFGDHTDGLDAAIAIADAIVSKREQARGPKTIALYQPLISLSSIYAAQAAATGNAGYMERSYEARQRAIDIATAAGAPADGIRFAAADMAFAKAMRPNMGMAAMAAAASALVETLASLPSMDDITVARITRNFLIADSTPPEVARTIAERARAALLKRGAAPAGPEVRALTASILDIRRKLGETTGSDVLVRSMGLAAGSCGLLAAPPTMDQPSQAIIGPDSYPKDLLAPPIDGIVQVAMDIDARGGSTNNRIVYASPPRLFDEVTLAGTRQFRFEPAAGAKSVPACRGYSQQIRWEVPKD